MSRRKQSELALTELKLRILIRFNHFLRKVVTRTHREQLNLQWGNNKRNMWFDRNLAFSTINSNDCTNYTERIAFSTFFLHESAVTLELGFGDGYASGNYLARNSVKLLAVDNDESAYLSARENFPQLADCFILGDYLNNFPTGSYTNVVWDAGIGYFNEIDRNRILEEIKLSLSDRGVLTGFTIQAGVTTHESYQYLPGSKEELLEWLGSHFKDVMVIEKAINPKNAHEKGFFFFCSADGGILGEKMITSWGVNQ